MKLALHAAATVLTLLTFAALSAEAQVPIDSGNVHVQRMQSGWYSGSGVKFPLGGPYLHDVVLAANGYISVSDPSLPSGEGILIDCAVFNSIHVEYMLLYGASHEAQYVTMQALNEAEARLNADPNNEAAFREWERAKEANWTALSICHSIWEDLTIVEALLQLAGC